MPRYFFDVHNIFASADETGQELPNDEAAWHEATVFAGEIFKDMDGNIRPGQDWAVNVTDRDRNPIFDIRINTRKLR
ncbi:hypothetical protein [Bradyrhizobium sp.]|uniref:DUF6894 family protein n=1 Tax=Bradyrhizobium sp. TaxID=376 RepID=UPI00263A0796|nr:hypothetical protein [Bradyrhizobium sp.]